MFLILIIHIAVKVVCSLFGVAAHAHACWSLTLTHFLLGCFSNVNTCLTFNLLHLWIRIYLKKSRLYAVKKHTHCLVALPSAALLHPINLFNEVMLQITLLASATWHFWQQEMFFFTLKLKCWQYQQNYYIWNIKYLKLNFQWRQILDLWDVTVDGTTLHDMTEIETKQPAKCPLPVFSLLHSSGVSVSKQVLSVT